MKTLILSIVSIFLITLTISSQSCPTTANCGCSNKSKAVCPTDPCCQWIVGTGCKCKNIVTSIDNIQRNDVNLFPNPVEDILNIQFSNRNPVLIDIISIDGLVVFSKKLLDTNNNQVNLKGIKKGLYIFRLKDGDKVYFLKILKN